MEQGNGKYLSKQIAIEAIFFIHFTRPLQDLVQV
jgi:hypothetical protein